MVYNQGQTCPPERFTSRKHLIDNRQVTPLRTRLANQLAQLHPQLRKALLRNLSELAAARTLPPNVLQGQGFPSRLAAGQALGA